MADFDDIPETALRWVRDGKGAALATVVQTWGSAPRGVGSQLAISSETELAGSVSGGCVEGAVVEEALEALEDGTPRILEYGVTDEDAFAVGLACGGTIRILVEPIGVGDGMSVEMLAELTAYRAARQAVAYRVNVTDWSRDLVLASAAPELAERFRDDTSGFELDIFINIHNPPLRMMIVGAVHIAQPLVQMARLTGYDPVVIDPRAAFGSESRFPEERLRHDWPDAALLAEGLDARVAVVTLSHDPKIDDPAIATALRSDVFYLGCLGSSRTHAKRVVRMQAAGFTPAEIARIHAPIGADIGAKSPAEIAVSIMAEITERLRRPDTRR